MKETKETYETPVVEIIPIDEADIICDSGFSGSCSGVLVAEC